MNVTRINALWITWLVGLWTLLAACNTVLDKKAPSPRAPEKGQKSNAANQNPNYSPNAHVSIADHSPVYVAIGGWNSCVQDPRIPGQVSPYGMNMNKQFSKMVKHLEARYPGQPVKFIIACHTPDQSVVRYVMSNQPSQLHIKSHEQLYADAANFARSNRVPLVFLGHSYGGAYVMNAALSLPADVQISHLITIDAISPHNCPPSVMVDLISNRISQIGGQGNINNPAGLGCQQAPRDYTPEQKQKIRARVTWWQNYFQSDLLSILKADSIPEACNQSVAHKEIGMLLNGHIAMGMYESLWADIIDRLTNPTPYECVERSI